jgi:hypothetical protein
MSRGVYEGRDLGRLGDRIAGELENPQASRVATGGS